MADPLAIDLHESEARTASGSGDAVDIEALRSACRLRLVVTAASGTAPTLTVKIQTGPTEEGPWSTLDTFSSIKTTAAPAEITVAGCDRYVRATWEIAGADPSFTFTLSGTAEVLYASIADVERFSMPAAALANVDAKAKADALLTATDEAASYIAAGCTMPLVSWGSDLRRHVAKMAGFEIMSVRGFRPDGFDDLIVKGKDDAIVWLKAVASGAAVPPDLVDSDVERFEPSGVVVTTARRGW